MRLQDKPLHIAIYVGVLALIVIAWPTVAAWVNPKPNRVQVADDYIWYCVRTEDGWLIERGNNGEPERIHDPEHKNHPRYGRGNW
jgi:hypothetical protein